MAINIDTGGSSPSEGGGSGYTGTAQVTFDVSASVTASASARTVSDTTDCLLSVDGDTSWITLPTTQRISLDAGFYVFSWEFELTDPVAENEQITTNFAAVSGEYLPDLIRMATPVAAAIDSQLGTDSAFFVVPAASTFNVTQALAAGSVTSPYLTMTISKIG